MKKLLVLLLMLAMTVALASCDVQATVNKLLGKEEAHTHEYEKTVTDEPTCTAGGSALYTCSCGDSYTEELDELGHDMQKSAEVPANCSQYGYITYKCTRCPKKTNESLKPIGHIWGEEVESSRLILCKREGCSGGLMPEGNGKYDEVLVFKYSDADKEEFAAKYDAFVAEINALDAFNKELHAASLGTLTEEFEAFDAKHTEIYDLLLYAMAQRQVAEIAYYCNMSDKSIKAAYDDMAEYYTDIVGKFYELFEPISKCKFREYFFEGMSDEEITAYLASSGSYSNPEYLELKKDNERIESEFLALTREQMGGSDKVPELYHEFVENNKKIATLLGYDNYVEYAYDSIYERDYSYEDAQVAIDYAKKYLGLAFNSIYSKWKNVTSNLKEEDIEGYYTFVDYSFFSNIIANDAVNDYIDLLEFNAGTDNSISFSDEFNKLMADGNMFRGDYEGAFVTYIYDSELPVAYFGKGYDNSFTVVHEFGHYMNEVYNKSEYNQSYDLLEMHSQGNEMLYLSTLEAYYMSDNVQEMVETYSILNMLATVMHSIAVDAFERAVYTGVYEGTASEEIMADGVIAADEYDALFISILDDLGVTSNATTNYWRFMGITSPCYYISYALSAVSVMPLYYMAQDDFDAAKDAYFKLFTYTDAYVGEDYTEMTTVEILENAGLYSFFDEELYKYLGKKIQ